jgi:hypothetical protein
MNEQATIRLQFHGMSFEISGPENFVTQQSELYREQIVELLLKAARLLDDDLALKEEIEEAPPAAPHQQPTGKPAFTNVLHVENDKVKILKRIPGTTLSKRAVNTAVIFLWAKRNLGMDAIPFADLRDICEEQGCLDSGNFSYHMRSAREWMIVDGAKGSSAQTAKLTLPGVERAKELLRELNGDESPDDS